MNVSLSLYLMGIRMDISGWSPTHCVGQNAGESYQHGKRGAVQLSSFRHICGGQCIAHVDQYLSSFVRIRKWQLNSNS